jgi:hypothetical protein
VIKHRLGRADTERDVEQHASRRRIPRASAMLFDQLPDLLIARTTQAEALGGATDAPVIWAAVSRWCASRSISARTRGEIRGAKNIAHSVPAQAPRPCAEFVPNL